MLCMGMYYRRLCLLLISLRQSLDQMHSLSEIRNKKTVMTVFRLTLETVFILGGLF
jgi:hypothetical protein